MRMKRKTALAGLTLAVLTFGACGGGGSDEDARQGRIEAAATGEQAAAAPPANKDGGPPEGEQATKVTEHQTKGTCGPYYAAAWNESPKSLKEAASKSKRVVEAEVLEVKKGADIVVEAPAEPGGSYRIPTQEVTIKVIKKHKGPGAEGETITLFQTGSECKTIEGDPAYVKGEKHLLMLTDGPNGKERTISPEGRYKQKDDGTLEPTTHGPAADQARGKKVKDIENDLK